MLERFSLATDETVAQAQLVRALTDDSDSSWPEAHYLSPLHPVLDWAADRALSKLSRNAVYVVRGKVDLPAVLAVGTLTDRRGLVVTASWMCIRFLDPENLTSPWITMHTSSADMLADVGVGADMSNPGPVARPDDLKPLVELAMNAADEELKSTFDAAKEGTQDRIAAWNHKTVAWQEDSQTLIPNHALRIRRTSVEEEKQLIADMEPQQRLARPLLVVVPENYPTAHEECDHAKQ